MGSVSNETVKFAKGQCTSIKANPFHLKKKNKKKNIKTYQALELLPSPLACDLSYCQGTQPPRLPKASISGRHHHIFKSRAYTRQSKIKALRNQREKLQWLFVMVRVRL